MSQYVDETIGKMDQIEEAEQRLEHIKAVQKNIEDILFRELLEKCKISFNDWNNGRMSQKLFGDKQPCAVYLDEMTKFFQTEYHIAKKHLDSLK